MTEPVSTSACSSASEDTMADFTTATPREVLNTTNPRGNSNINQGINVEAAEEEFRELNRQMSEISRTASRKISRTQNRESTDPEKAVRFDEEEEEEQFDLEAHLRGNETSEREAGIKQKKIGILHLGQLLHGHTELMNGFRCCLARFDCFRYWRS